MRVLLTEIGNNSSGDEAICIAAARRLLAMGTTVTFCYRTNLEDSLRSAGLTVRQVHMPIQERFDSICSVDKLVSAFAERRPELYRTLRSVLLDHDVVAVAPGGKFTEGLNNPVALLTSAVSLSLGVPVIILHQSVGPIDNPDHRTLLSEVFSRSLVCLVRDDRSFTFLLELGIPSKKLARCRDVAIGEDYPLTDSTDYDIGINIRYGFTGSIKLEALSRIIRHYNIFRPGGRILVYSTTWNIPSEIINSLSSLPCDIEAIMPSYPDYLRKVGRCAINVSDSWHGCIFSMMAGRPVICCQTDLKTWKLQGAHAPSQEPLEVLPGLISKHDADVVLDRVIAAESNPFHVMEHQRRLIQYGKELCEEGWAVVNKTLRGINPHSYSL
ncbi:MAG TPA: polysaccharide pyruvyl transferase family protein [Nitrospirae bacterium]|nr:polysaccharide pyruvyl transferase family protein [Nitrospirota bacterium]